MGDAYYNENDPFAAAWLRNLIEAGLIARGEVDTRSIVDVRGPDLAGFDQCHFFAGLGGWSGALRLAGFPDDRPVWTGSCPCQPFSLAGKRGGFADERHLWPVWRELVAERRPSKVYGEQVASAAQWLRLVRGDLEALGYAVGAIPVEAASAGADHLRDRLWFMADADDTRSQGRPPLPECADQRPAGPDGMADSDELGESKGWQQRSGQFGRTRGDPQTCDGGYMGHASGARAGRNCGSITREEAESSGPWQVARHFGDESLISNPSSLEWVIGADGKARRVKSGVRLLAHGVPARVAKLRALGNAIDLRPAAAFIKATM